MFQNAFNGFSVIGESVALCTMVLDTNEVLYASVRVLRMCPTDHGTSGIE